MAFVFIDISFEVSIEDTRPLNYNMNQPSKDEMRPTLRAK